MVLLQTLIRYALVGGGAAAIHLLLLLLPRVAPYPLANVAGYLTAPLWGYVLHAVLTFRLQTSGELFPRRWLLLQLVINLSLSLALPRWSPLATHPVGIALLVFTPTARMLWCGGWRPIRSSVSAAVMGWSPRPCSSMPMTSACAQRSMTRSWRWRTAACCKAPA